jgi:hypothetical protein
MKSAITWTQYRITLPLPQFTLLVALSLLSHFGHSTDRKEKLMREDCSKHNSFYNISLLLFKDSLKYLISHFCFDKDKS